MNEEDFEREISGSGTDPQVVAPVNINFEVSCTIDPTHPGKPVCKLKYKKPPFLGLVEVVEDEVDAEVSEEPIEVEEDEASSDSVKESKLKGMKKLNPEKISGKSAGEADESETERASEMIIRCVAKSVEDSA